MRVAVIGAGVVGVTTAYFIAQKGHQVSVIEQRGNVAEEASLGHAGLLGAAHLAPWAAPGMPGRIFSPFRRAERPASWRLSTTTAHWRWLRRWLSECDAQRFLINTGTIRRLGAYSQELLQDLSHLHQIDFHHRSGVLSLLRTKKDQLNLEPGLELLTQENLPFQLLDATACHTLEPALNTETALHGGIYFPEDGSGNCALFTKQLRQVTQKMGVKFNFLQHCEHINPTDTGIVLHLNEGDKPTQHHFDALVLAAGVNSAVFLKRLGITIPIAQFQSYSGTALIKNPEAMPNLSILDDSFQLAITRMDKRIRIAGTSHLGRHKTSLDQHAWQTLRNSAHDWFPNAANYHTAQTWSGSHLMLPDGAPIIGSSPIKNLYLNLAHAENGWGMAAGSGKIVADLISGLTPDIALTGLTLACRNR